MRRTEPSLITSAGNGEQARIAYLEDVSTWYGSGVGAGGPPGGEPWWSPSGTVPAAQEPRDGAATSPVEARMRLCRQVAGENLVRAVERAIAKTIAAGTTIDDLTVRAEIGGATSDQQHALVDLYRTLGWRVEVVEHAHGAFHAGPAGVSGSEIWFDLVLRTP